MIYISVFIHSMSSLFEFLEPSSSLATALIKTTWYTRIIAILMTGIWLNKGNRSTGRFKFQGKKRLFGLSAWVVHGIQKAFTIWWCRLERQSAGKPLIGARVWGLKIMFSVTWPFWRVLKMLTVPHELPSTTVPYNYGPFSKKLDAGASKIKLTYLL